MVLDRIFVENRWLLVGCGGLAFWLVWHREVIKFANALDIVNFFTYRNHITPVLEYGYNSGQCPTQIFRSKKKERHTFMQRSQSFNDEKRSENPGSGSAHCWY